MSTITFNGSGVLTPQIVSANGGGSLNSNNRYH
jgi:hypothetical protein